jgi:8-oxo-dGTP diphosphatase
MDYKDKFCNYCGSQYTGTANYPRNCEGCGRQVWSNPTTVVVAMLVVEYPDGELGLLVQQRNIEPEKGNWALTGGYINTGETWQEAAAREVKEELNLETDPSKYELFSVEHGNGNKTLLVFSVYTESLSLDVLTNFVPNEEVTAVNVMFKESTLAFPTHTDCANRFLAEIRGINNV